MAAPWNPPAKGEDFEFPITLDDYNVAGRFKAAPTIASGDFKISKDGGAFANLASLPTVSPAGGKGVVVVLSSTEMTADKVLVIWSDQTEPPEWCDGAYGFLTTQ